MRLIDLVLQWSNNLFGEIFAPGWVSSAFWNALVGLLGIYFTVLFIDRRAEKREDARWQPAKNNVYYKLFQYLVDIVRYLQMADKWKEDKFFIYFFGVYYIGIRYDVKKLNYQEVVSFGNQIKGLTPFIVSELEEVIINIDDLLDKFPQLFEPELLDEILHFKERFEPIINKLNRYMEIDPDDREGSIDLCPMAEYVFSLLVLLSTRTSKIINNPNDIK